MSYPLPDAEGEALEPECQPETWEVDYQRDFDDDWRSWEHEPDIAADRAGPC